MWPLRVDARMKLAPSQPPATHLQVKLRSRLRYDFPTRSQLWEYWALSNSSTAKDKKPEFAELWINETLYELDWSTDPPGCYMSKIGLEVLRPDWLVHTTYVGSHYLLRQPSRHGINSLCYTPSNELSGLFQDPAPIGGITNNWLVFNSSIGEPMRLEGPDDFAHPTWLTVQEYSSFEGVARHDPATFAIPASCRKANEPLELQASRAAAVNQPHHGLGRMQPHLKHGGSLWQRFLDAE